MALRNHDFSSEPVVLEVENLIIGLPGGTPVLGSVSFNIRKGETVCLVGESGSGKSVTSLAVMGLLPKGALLVNNGVIKLDGTDLLKLSLQEMKKMRATRVSMIFQEPMTALNPVIRVGEQITEVLDIHTNLTAAEKRSKVINIMEQVHLPDVERIYQSYPHQLSGGQRQRIMIAMALIMEPAVLIADEPTTALDVTTQKQILALISELQEKHGTAVLFITHDMGVVAEIADRVCVMRSGEIVEHGTIREVLTNPQQQYTKDLLAAVPSLNPRASRAEVTIEPVIKVRDLGMTYKAGGLFRMKSGTRASREVSFNLQPGKTLGIVGESGSGKTTVARSIMRLIEPTEGEIIIDDCDIAHLSRRDLKPFRKKMQVVFQDPFVHLILAGQLSKVSPKGR